MNPKIKKWIVRPLLILLITVFVLAGVGLIVLLTQQQRLVNLAVAAVNKQFKGELAIETSSISPFKNFPYVSVALHEVRFFPTKATTGKPLAEIGRLYVGFSLPDILQQQYNVRRLFIQGGYVDLTRKENGQLDIVEATTLQADTTAVAPSTGEATAFEVDLQQIVLKDLTFSYTDKASGQQISSSIEKIVSSFRIDSANIAATLEGGMNLDLATPTDTSFFRHKHLQVNLKGDYNTARQYLTITTGGLLLEQASFNVTGTASLAQQTEVDFHIQGDKPDFNLINAFLPPDAKTALKPFQYDGRIYFDGKVKGIIAENQQPHIDVTFGCEEAWFLNTTSEKKVDQLGFKGYYTNGRENSLKTSELHITNVNARPEKGIFKGNFVMRDFTDPHVLMQIKSELELKFLGQFLGIPGLQQITGKIKLDMNFKEITDIELPEQALNKLKDGLQSELSVENLAFRIPGYPHQVRDMNVHAKMKDGRITLDSVFLRIGNSDLRIDGSLSDLPALLHHPEKPVTVTMNARSQNLILKELFAHDTAMSRKMQEEIHGFNIGVALQTSANQLKHPAPLPKGKFELKNLSASFKKYPHAFHDLGATLTINDTALLLRNFTGMIDKSDIRFSGRVVNYQLWFADYKKGKTQIAFDFKSNRFAMDDLLGPISRKLVPPGYRHEEANDVWLRSKIDLKYDTVFKIARIKIANISANLKQHGLQLKDIKGKLVYASKIMKADTLRGTIGRSDFDINFRYYTGDNPKYKGKHNYLYFNSTFLDLDQITQYDLSAGTDSAEIIAPTAAVTTPATTTAATSKDTSQHATAFNVFMIPFSTFDVQVNIGKLKYNKLWLRDAQARIRMQEDHHIYIDTLSTRVAGGTLAMRGHFNGNDPNKIYLRSRIKVDQVDLEKMLLKLDHFGQDVVINKNIKGRVSGQIKSYVRIHPDFVPILDNSKAEVNVSIYKGSLVDFAPMQAMAGYFKDKNLRMISFDTLHNVLTFADGVLNIPSMNINSSLGFVEISGKQSLDLKMEYYIRVPLKMVTKVGFSSLFGKKQEDVDLDQVDAIEYADKDKKTRFMNLRVTGTPGDFKIGLGKDKRRS
ncbi:AsmA family protein [Parachryseolinea silvisoli]|uniref:AsmA family protein n=1 Tax=Parachryseolinea silvisoli TaxID=2873601 RepID=UPI002265CB8B|nr:AsmA-like C-terminal region-containing protein [Parachryseolinea silvisoli]MCD9014836.1 AsmA family protein [Parachryseolinea silvisoli]